jgi:TBC1 domain family member 20
MIHSLLSSLPDLSDDDGSDESPLLAPVPPHVPTASLTSNGEKSITPSDDPAIFDSSTSDESKTDLRTTTPDEVVSVDSDASATSRAGDVTLVDDPLYAEKAERALSPATEEERTLVEDESESGLEHTSKTSNDATGPPQIASETVDPTGHSVAEEETRATDGIRRPRIHISTLLERADRLFALYPPMDPSINLPSVMGPASVMLTWSENPAHLPKDDEAEMMVTRPHLVVLPLPDEGEREKDEDASEEGTHRGSHKHRRRRLQKPRRITDLVVQRRVVASAVLVLGVAMAVYGLQASTPERHHGAAGRELRRVSRLLGGFVVGMGGRLLDGLLAMSG